VKTLRPPTLLLLLLLAGCRGPDTIDVAPGAALRLCPPEAAPDFFLNQEVVITLPDGSRETLMAAMENRRGVLGLVAATPLGQTLFSIRVRDGKALVDVRAPLPGRFDPRMLPALVQFALWPEAAVRAGLGPGLRLEQYGARRELLLRDQLVWSATRTGEALVMEAPGLGLRLRIRTLDDL
jgi:hypothetical protein